MTTTQQPAGDSPLARQTAPTIGFVLSHEQFPVTDLLEYGARAEQAGFAAISTSDHFHPWQDNEGHAGFAWVTLGALGGRMPRIPFGTGITCPTYRYRPAIVAQAFATLGCLYPGRVFLGVGTGEALNEVPSGGGWGPYPERAARLVEAVQIIRQLWSGEGVNYEGEYYQVKNARLDDPPPQPVPIYIAASGEKSMRLAGQYGDGLITDPQSLKKPGSRAAYEAGARAAGKDPARLPILVEQWVIVGDEAEARRWTPLWRFTPKAWEKYVTNPDPREIQRQAEQDVPLADVYAGWTVSPDPQVHADGITKLAADGVTHVFVHSPQADQQRVIEFYGRDVLPRLRGR